LCRPRALRNQPVFTIPAPPLIPVKNKKTRRFTNPSPQKDHLLSYAGMRTTTLTC